MAEPTPLEAMAAMKPAPAPDLREPAAKTGLAYDEMPLAEACPVVPLGVNGETNFFLDDLRQLRAYGPKLDKGVLYSLCGGNLPWLDEAFPMYNDKGDQIPGKFNQDKAQRAFIRACQSRGLFDPTDAVRGRGSHLGPTGELILHCGDELLIAGQRAVSGKKLVKPPYWRSTGLHGELIFPTAKTIKHPDTRAANPDDMAALLCTHFNSWNFQGTRQVDTGYGGVNIQAYLTFAWAQMAKVCGAVPSRPSLWITGPSSAGKSGLHDTLRAHVGRGHHLATKDMTASWASQTLQHDRLAVMFDEAEPDAQLGTNYHAQILQLAKLAYDGSSKGRGGADGKAHTTEIHSCFQFSSVITPNMKPEDRNRMIIVEVDKFPAGTPPYIQPDSVEALAMPATRRMCEQWHRFADTLKVYRGAMMARNWSAREANTYGTVLAAGDLALYDDTPDVSEAGDGRVLRLLDAVEPMLATSRAEGEDHPELCVQQLLSVRLPSKPGTEQETVGQWIKKACVEAVTHAGSKSKRPVDEKLQTHGLRLVNLSPGHESGQGGLSRQLEQWPTGYLVVGGRSHQGAAATFKDTDFSNGRWMRALERLKHKVLNDDGTEKGIIPAVRNKRARIGGPNVPCILVPVAALVNFDDVEEAVEAAKWAATEGTQDHAEVRG